MPSLRELQSAFGALLLDPAETPAPRGIAVYRGNVYGNWRNALAAAYPIVRKIVGEEFFDGMAHEYARAHSSTSGDLNEYGARLPEFIAAFRHTQDLPYLPDVARMERLAHRAYYAADAAAFDFTRIAGVPPDRQAALRPVLAPACALLASDWPLARIWTVHQDDYHGDPAFNGDEGPERILVHRPRWRAEVCCLTAGEYGFLEAAFAGMTLGAALEAAVAAEPAFDPSTALSRWVQAGVIARIDA